ncbi:PspC domain-containing protein [Sungkyunkwania multivorans]|uniref:PspC domain-containing protein n=1 Tax=Sungkyunkwania multivorans TaxID=1173618 RepID=A0ABW3CT09_9FLAO
MNKTININLAGTFFHIDEDAYNKLQRYLNAIRRSFTDSQGRDEIIADIEARISELFTEKMENDRQVIGMKQLDEVIAVMGQPEDYLVDDEIFEDEPKKEKPRTRTYKQLFRDTDNQYISGVSSGLGHYLGIDAVWIRILWIILTFFSGGSLILIYILLWVLIPAAQTTAEKLEMRGKPVNISNIEKKVKEGFDDVTDKVKNADYEGMGKKAKSGATSFFEAIGNIIAFFFKIIIKFIGIILIIVAAATLIGLFVGFFSVGIADIVHFPGWDLADMANVTGVPLWVVSMLAFFAIGIPFFFLLILGLKILVDNLKSIGRTAKYSLLGLWLLSIISLIVIGAKEAAEHAFEGSISEKKELYISPADTLKVAMAANEAYEDRLFRNSNVNIVYGDNGNDKLYSEEVYLNIRRSNDSVAYIKIEKESHGNSYANARAHASDIEFNYTLLGNQLALDEFFLTDLDAKFRDQNVFITLYLPEGAVVDLDDSTYDYISSRIRLDQDFYRRSAAGKLWKIGEGNRLICLNCPEKSSDTDEDESNKLIINEDGVDINVKSNDGKFKVKIDEDGVEVKTNEQ